MYFIHLLKGRSLQSSISWSSLSIPSPSAVLPMLEDDNLDIVCNGIVIVYLQYVIAYKKNETDGVN